jgi:hypothetical protein
MSNIKTFDQYIEEMHHQGDQFPDEFFDVIGDSKATQMLVSLTKTVQTDSPSTTGRSVYDTLMKEMMKAIEGVDGFLFAGDSYNREQNDKGGFTIVANIKLLYNVPADDDDVDLNAVFSGMSADVDVAISEVE